MPKRGPRRSPDGSLRLFVGAVVVDSAAVAAVVDFTEEEAVAGVRRRPPLTMSLFSEQFLQVSQRLCTFTRLVRHRHARSCNQEIGHSVVSRSTTATVQYSSHSRLSKR
jgi:hypothetical protein